MKDKQSHFDVAVVTWILDVESSAFSKHVRVSPQWVVVGKLWDSVGRANTHISHMGPNWVCPHRATVRQPLHFVWLLFC